MAKRLGTALRNPLLLILPFVAFLAVGWFLYMHVLNAPSHAQHNLLHTAHDGKMPDGWQVEGSMPHSLTSIRGYIGGHAFGVRVGVAKSGNVSIRSDVARVSSDRTYLYKAYHQSQIPFSLLIKYFYEDGSSSLQLVKQYGASSKWTTNSYAFHTDNRTVGVQLQYDLNKPGTLWLDRDYLDQRTTDVLAAKPDVTGINLVQNGSLTASDDGVMPNDWQTEQAGNNDASFSYDSKDGQTYLRTSINKYKDGDAGWSSSSISVAAGQYDWLSVRYRATAPAKLLALYDLDDGSQITVPVLDLMPEDEWTTVSAFTEAPPHAFAMRISVKLSAAGSVDTTNYQVKDNTKPGARHFQRPLVSIIFGDGWASTYTTTSRIMGYLGYKGTFYVNPGLINQGPFLRESQIRQLLHNGNQLASASYEQVDLTTLNSLQLDRELRLASGYLRSNLGQSSLSFMPPFDRSDAEVEAVTQKYFRSSVSGGEGINTKQNFDAYNLKTLHIDKDTSAHHIADALQEAKNDNGWLILAYDRVQDNTAATSAVSSKAFTDQMQQVYDSNIPVMTIDNALEEVWGQ